MDNKNTGYPESDAPNPLKMRRSAAEPTYQRIEDKGDEPVITHFRPIKPSGSGINLLGLVIPIGVTLAIGAAGYFGVMHVKAQNARIIAAEKGATEAESAREARRRLLSDMTSEIRDTKARIPREIEKAKRDAEYKATAEFTEEIATLTRNIADANSAGRAAAQKVETDLRAKIESLRTKAKELSSKADAAATYNRETKAWLNAHTSTMHPRY